MPGQYFLGFSNTNICVFKYASISRMALHHLLVRGLMVSQTTPFVFFSGLAVTSSDPAPSNHLFIELYCWMACMGLTSFGAPIYVGSSSKITSLTVVQSFLAHLRPDLQACLFVFIFVTNDEDNIQV